MIKNTSTCVIVAFLSGVIGAHPSGQTSNVRDRDLGSGDCARLSTLTSRRVFGSVPIVRYFTCSSPAARSRPGARHESGC